MGWRDTIKAGRQKSWRDTIETPASKTESGLRGAAQGLTASWADEIAGGAGAIYDDIKSVFTGDFKGPKPEFDENGNVVNGAELKGTYEQRRNEYRKADAKAKKDNPVTYGASELGGSVATAFIPGVNTVKGAAALGAVTGLGTSNEEDLAGMAKDTALGGVAGGAAQKYLPGAIDKVKGAAGWVGKKVGNVGFNVSEEATEKYLNEPERMRKIIEEGSDGLRGIKDRVDDKYDEMVARPLEEAKGRVVDAKQGVRDARATLRETEAEYRNARPPEIDGDIINAIRGEDKKLSELSGKAFDTLEGSEFPRDQLLDKIRSIKGNLLVDGQAPKLGDSAPAWGILTRLEEVIASGKKPKLDGLMNEVEEIPGVAGRDLKKLIQQLDQESSAAYSTYGTRGAAKHIKRSRDEISDMVKEAVPEYREAMVPTAEQAKVLAGLKKVFGTEDKARRALVLAGDPVKGEGVRTLLKNLDNTNGTNFLGQMEDYLAVQRVMKDPEARLAMQRGILSPAEQELKLAQEVRDAARSAKLEMSRVGPKVSEKTIKSVGRGQNAEGERQLKALIGEEGLKDVKDYSLGQQFIVDRTNGSRRTAAGAIVGGAVGSLLGPLGTMAGLGGGAIAGAAIDKLGGQIWQKVLDGTLKVGPYAKVLENAAKSGQAAIGLMHLFLMQNYPDYQEAVGEN